MTLVLSEVSKVGIVMAADSIITFDVDRNGRPIEKQQKNWDKILLVQKIKAAVSYWGVIGAVNRQFNLWLKRVIESGAADGSYDDLDSFADYLATAMNEACGGKVLANNQHIGVHVAGYTKWPDGERRPAFYHVHNGHLGIQTKLETVRIGEKDYLKAVHPELVAEPRKLFEKHKDFPKENKGLNENLGILDSGYLTRNGDYFIYAVLAEHIEQALIYANHIPGVSIPRDRNSLGSRKGYIHLMLETMTKLYACSNLGRKIGGEVTSIAIGPTRYLR